MPIPIGKLSLYVAGAGFRPTSTLPICLDLGTNTQKYLDDPLYLGLRHKRVPQDVMTEFMDELMHEMATIFPKMLVQFEDFSTDSAFLYLERYRNRYPSFNDDIQGTGAVVLSGFINAARLSSAASGVPLTGHRILFLGSGSAGVGVGTQLMSFFRLQGLSDAEAKSRIYYVDSQGLIFDARGPMQEHKKFFSRKDYTGPAMTNLIDIISYVKPTALLGLSTTKGAFTREVVELMAALNPRPIIFPLSNPVRLCELDFQDAIEWTQGRVLFASGSPYDDVVYAGKRIECRQGNNMYIFPGLGLGSVLARAASVTDSMVEASSLGLADSLTPDERKTDSIYPSLERIREISAYVAMRVIRQAQKEGVDRSNDLRSMSDTQLLAFVVSKMWKP